MNMPVSRSQIADLTPRCPLCHTLDHTVSPDALAFGATWGCARCGQTWSAARLSAAAAYAEYAATL
jgi:hypothetical protein